MLKLELTESVYHINVLRVSLGEDSFEIDIHGLFKKLPEEDMYAYVNRYFATLPATKQVELYNVFKEINDSIVHDVESTEYMLELRRKVTHCLKVFGFNDFTEWYRNNCQTMVIPEGVPEEFVERPNKDKTIEKTYIVSKYIDLISLVMACRAMLPIYAEYWEYMNKTNIHPCLRVFQLFMGSEMETEDGTGALAELRTYIEENHATINKDQNKEYIVIGSGLSGDQVVDALTGLAIFVKFFLLDTETTKSKPVTHIYRLVEHDGKFFSFMPGYIKIKPKRQNTPDEDYSHFEGPRKTIDLTMGKEVIIQHSMRDTKVILASMGHDPSIVDGDFYQNELKNIGKFLEEPLDEIQLTLLEWFLAPFIDPPALTYNEDRRIIELMLAAKTQLILDGHEYIGVFLSCIAEEDSPFMNTNVLMRGTINKNLLAQLDPFLTFKLTDKANMIEKDILTISKHIVNLPWKPLGYCPDRFKNTEGYLLGPSDIVEVVIEYCKYILRRQIR